MWLPRTFRRWRYGAIEWFNDGDRFGKALVLLTVLLAVGFLALTPRSTTHAPFLRPSEGPIQAGSPQIPSQNRDGGYRFSYPSTWNLREEGARSRVESPSGDVVLSFGVSFTDGLGDVTTRMVRALPGSHHEIGTNRQRIAGAPAFLRSGITRNESKGLIRYLAIAIDGGSRRYTILITVPASGDPEELLSTVERIVASFGISSRPFI
jgi:hypothetical protein